MPSPASNSPPARRIARRAFTLIELVTAAALMTIMMLGVIQIFATITQTAGDAQGFQFAQEQHRAVMDLIDRDIRGLTREGYFRIVADPAAPTSGQYASDLVAFTTVGSVTGSWSSTPASAYEVVYTTHVQTPKYERYLKSSPAPDANNPQMDQRCGLLGRGLWLFTGRKGAATDQEDATLTSCLAEMSANLSLNPNSYRRSQNTLTVWPVTSTDGYPVAANAPSLREVLASRCSEFYVEYLVFDASATPPDYKWTHAGVDFYAGANRNCPRAIRVTTAIHDPDDRAPLSGSATRFRGYAMQEVFWIGDP